MIIQRLFSKKKDNKAEVAVGVGGGLLTAGAIGHSSHKINKSSKNKLEKYKGRVNEDLNKTINKINEDKQKKILESNEITNNSLNEGRRTYKKNLKDTKIGIKQAKKDLNASYENAARNIRAGSNEVTTSVNMNLPKQKFSKSETSGYDIKTPQQREQVAKLYDSKWSKDVNNNIINRETKNTISNLKTAHQTSQDNILREGKKRHDAILKEAANQESTARQTATNVINKRKSDLSAAAKKLKMKKGKKIAAIGLAGTGASVIGTHLYKNRKRD